MKIRAAVLRQMGLPAPYAQSKPLLIETIDLAPPGPGELLVRVTAAGLCHSDLSVIDGTRPRVMPMALGHEAAAEVVECGAGVVAYAPGDTVVFSFVPACGHCAPCASGRAALCEPGAKANVAGTLLSGARRLRDGAGEINHHLGVSGFAEYAVVAAASAVKIEPGLPPEIAANLFQKFRRGHNARAGGLGLGLSIVRGFMLAQGGEVTAGKSPEGGARFMLYLPYAAHGRVPDDDH